MLKSFLSLWCFDMPSSGRVAKHAMKTYMEQQSDAHNLLWSVDTFFLFKNINLGVGMARILTRTHGSERLWEEPNFVLECTVCDRQVFWRFALTMHGGLGIVLEYVNYLCNQASSLGSTYCCQGDYDGTDSWPWLWDNVVPVNVFPHNDLGGLWVWHLHQLNWVELIWVDLSWVSCHNLCRSDKTGSQTS